MGINSELISVRLYSTLAGTSGYCFLTIKPSPSNSFKVLDRTAFVTPFILRFSSLYRVTPSWYNEHSTGIFHLPPIRASATERGQRAWQGHLFLQTFSGIAACSIAFRTIDNLQRSITDLSKTGNKPKNPLTDYHLSIIFISGIFIIPDIIFGGLL
jgi:hypothetical protein